MDCKNIIEITAEIATVIAVIIALFANRLANKNTRKQIRIDKLESLYEAIQFFAMYYDRYMSLYFDVRAYQDKDNKEIQSLSDYHKKRDEKLSKEDINQIRTQLSRIELLAKCYTSGSLQSEFLKFRDLTFSFSDLVLNGGSLHYEMKYKQSGFPDYDKFYKMVEDLKDKIVAEMAMGK